MSVEAAAASRSVLFISIVAFTSASVWGLFWLPLREIDAQGLTGPWAIIAINLLLMVLFLPVAFLRRAHIQKDFRKVVTIGFLMAGGLVFYMLGLVYTSIMRATLLFYLTPVWSTLFGIFLLGEKTHWRRWAAIVLGFAGLIFILAAKGSAAGDLNVGDAMGFISGIIWGAGAAYARLHDEVNPADTSAIIYFFSTIMGIALVWIMLDPNDPIPGIDAWIGAAPAVLGFSLIVFAPTLYLVIWCAQRLSPGRVGILMMSEVLVAGISAPLLAGEVLTLQEFFGAVLIIGAGVLEVLTPVEQSA